MLVDIQFPTVICAPIHTKYEDIPTQVDVGVDEGLKHDSAIYCDSLVSVPKNLLNDYVGHLSDNKIQEVNIALRIALAVE
jgi:mRNA interferase MazF